MCNSKIFSQLVSIDELLLYKNNKVVERYTKDYSTNLLSGEEAFEELLKFLWLSRKLEFDKETAVVNKVFSEIGTNKLVDSVCVMHHEMSDIDDMWHTFLLFTNDYIDFCYQYFGKYMHHKPFTEEDEIPTEEKFFDDLSRFLSYINENLGEKTLLKWFGKLL